MSTNIKNPNKSSSGFIWAVVALLVIAAAVIGYIIISGNKAVEQKYADQYSEPVAFEASFNDDGLTLQSDKATADAKQVELYEDFSCSYCAQLAQSTDADMKSAIEDGSVVVTVHALNFLDRSELGNSTKAGAAAYTLAMNEAPQVYWNFRALLFEQQQDIYGQWDNADFAKVAQSLGASDESVKAIEDGANIDKFTEIATANADRLQKDTGRVSSPRVFVDGTEIEGEQVYDWVNSVAKA